MLKKMKNWAPLALAALALMLSSCGDSSSSTNPGLLLGLINQGPTSTVTIESHKNGEIVKNKVVTDSGDEYYEYFEFTTEDGTSGNYSLYKKTGNTNTIQTVSPLDGSTLPTTFTYDKSNGGYTVGSSTSYLFDAPKDGVKVNVIASELMTTEDTNVAFTSKWVSSSGEYVFDGNETVLWDDINYSYTKDGGWVTLTYNTTEGIPFYWDNVSKFYHLVYETERTEVEEVGRGLNDVNIVYSSPIFIYGKLNK
jgi:hypothetical protein